MAVKRTPDNGSYYNQICVWKGEKMTETFGQEVSYDLYSLSKDTGLSLFMIKKTLGIKPSFEDTKRVLRSFELWPEEIKAFNEECKQTLSDITDLESAKFALQKLQGTGFEREAGERYEVLANKKVEEVSSVDELLALISDLPFRFSRKDVFVKRGVDLASSPEEFLRFVKSSEIGYVRSGIVAERAKSFAEELVKNFDSNLRALETFIALSNLSDDFDDLNNDFLESLTAFISSESDLDKLLSLQNKLYSVVGYNRREGELVFLLLKKKIFKAWESTFNQATSFEEAFDVFFSPSVDGKQRFSQKNLRKMFSFVATYDQFEKLFQMIENLFEDGLKDLILEEWLRIVMSLPESQRYQTLTTGLYPDDGVFYWVSYPLTRKIEAIDFIVSKAEDSDTLLELKRACSNWDRLPHDAYVRLNGRLMEVLEKEVVASEDIKWLVSVLGLAGGDLSKKAWSKARELTLKAISSSDPERVVYYRTGADQEIVNACNARLELLAEYAVNLNHPDKSYLVGFVHNLPKDSAVWPKVLVKLADFYKI